MAFIQVDTGALQQIIKRIQAIPCLFTSPKGFNERSQQAKLQSVTTIRYNLALFRD